MYLHLFYFSIHWIKIPDGYQIAGFGGVRLVVNQSVVPVDFGVFARRLESTFRCLILWGYFPFNNTLCNEYCLLILPWFVAVCEIWLPGLTYSVYLVLPLKPGATFGHHILNAAFPPKYRPPTNIPKYSGVTNPGLWLEDYRLAC